MGQKGDEEEGVQDDQLVTVQPVDHLPEKKEVKEISANIEGAQRLLRLITLAASIQMSQGQGGDNEEQGEEDLMTFYMFCGRLHHLHHCNCPWHPVAEFFLSRKVV